MAGQRERRGEPRCRTLRGGQIINGSGVAVLDCTIRNVSVGGAKLVLDQQRDMPELFRVDLEGSRRPVETVWQIGEEVGIRFLDVRQ